MPSAVLRLRRQGALEDVASSDSEGVWVPDEDKELEVTETGLLSTEPKVASREKYKKHKKERKEARKRIRRSYSCVSRGGSVYKDPPLFLAPTSKSAPAERRAEKRKLLEELRAEQALSDDEGEPAAASSSSRGPQEAPVDKKLLGVILHQAVTDTSKFARKVLGVSRKDKKALITEARSAVTAGFTGKSKASPTTRGP